MQALMTGSDKWEKKIKNQETNIRLYVNEEDIIIIISICVKIVYRPIPSDSGLCHGRSPGLSVAFMQLSCLHPFRVEFPEASSK